MAGRYVSEKLGSTYSSAAPPPAAPPAETTSTTTSSPQNYSQKSDAATAPKQENKREDAKKAANPSADVNTVIASVIPKVDDNLGGTKGKIDTTGGMPSFMDTYRSQGRGVVPREVSEPTPASIRIWGSNKTTGMKPQDLLPAYGKFFIESVQETHAERSQIVETFGDFYVFMYGERPPVYNFSGSLLNFRNASWAEDFMFMYNNYLRGTKCVQMNAVAIITYGGRQIEGLLLNMSTQTNAAIEGAVGLQFSVVVFDRKTYNFSEDLGFFTDPNSAGSVKVSPEWLAMLEKTAGRSGAGTSRQNVSRAQNATKKVAGGGASDTAVKQ